MTSDRPTVYIDPLQITPRVKRFQPRGLPTIDLSFNELPFAPVPKVQTAINQATQNANIYGNPSGELVRAALSECYQIDQEHIVVGNGSEELLDVIGRLFASRGDDIVISEYGYVQFPIVANRVGATLVKVPEKNFTTDVDGLIAAIGNATRIIYLANPNNPTGTMISAAEMTRLAEALPGNIVLVIDLAYGEFAGIDYCARMHELVSRFDNIIVTRTFSKAFGLAGLRLGWLHAPDWMIPCLYAARGMGTANAAAQAAGIAALADLQTIQSRVEQIISERDQVSNELSAMGLFVVPSKANFIMAACPDDGPIDDGARAGQLAHHLFDDAGIVVNQVRESGLERFIRFSMSLPENNSLLVKSVGRFLSSR